MKKFILPIFILLIAIGIYMLLSSMKKEQTRHKPGQFTRAVAAQVVQPATINPSIKAMGRVRSREVVELTPEVSGIVLSQNFRLRKGDSFRNGQTLLRIDSRLASNTYKTMISDLQNALASLLPDLKSDIPEAFERWNAFFALLSHDKPLPDLPDAINEREKLFVSRFNIYKLYFLAKNQGVTLSKHTLTAPFTGTVSDSKIFPASMVRAGVGVATLVSADNMEIELPLSSVEASLVKKGMTAMVTTDDMQEPITGTIHRMSGNLDERMQTVSVFVRVKNGSPNNLLDGAFATVSIKGEPMTQAFAVARKTVHDRNRVYTVNKGKLEEKEVTVAYNGIDTVYISGGLQELDTLIIEVLQDAVVGMAVQPVIDGKVIGGLEKGSGPGKTKSKE